MGDFIISPLVFSLSSRMGEDDKKSEETMILERSMRSFSVLFDDICGFNSPITGGLLSDTFAAVAGDSLRFYSVDSFDDPFDSLTFPLRYTPKDMIVDRTRSNLVIIETEYRQFSQSAREKIASDMSSVGGGLPLPVDFCFVCVFTVLCPCTSYI